MNVRVDGNVPGGALTVIGPVDLDFAEDLRYNVVAAGQVATIAPLVIATPDTPVAAGSVRAQVVHAAPQAPAVDVYVTAPGAILAQENPLGSLAFGEHLDPVELHAGEYQIRVTAATDVSAVVFDSGTVSLPEGADLMILAVENAGPGDAPISLFVAGEEESFEILDAETPAELRVIHASPDAPPVDVIVNDDFANPVLADVPFGAFSGYLAVPPGTYNVKITPAGNPGLIALDADLDVAAGTRYSFYASDLLTSIAPYVLVDDNRSIATQATVRIVHLGPERRPRRHLRDRARCRHRRLVALLLGRRLQGRNRLRRSCGTAL